MGIFVYIVFITHSKFKFGQYLISRVTAQVLHGILNKFCYFDVYTLFQLCLAFMQVDTLFVLSYSSVKLNILQMSI